MDIEWGVSKRSKASKRGKRIDRIVSSKLALLDGAESREEEFSKLFENFRPRIRHRNQISTDRSRGRERESFSRPYFGGYFCKRGRKLSGKRVNRRVLEKVDGIVPLKKNKPTSRMLFFYGESRRFVEEKLEWT